MNTTHRRLLRNMARAPVVLALALFVAALALAGAAYVLRVTAPSPVMADQAEFYLDCPSTSVREGETLNVYLVRVTDHQHSEEFGAQWRTTQGTADNNDYHRQNGYTTTSNSSETRANRLEHEIITQVDNTAEGDETFTIQFYNAGTVIDPDDPDRDDRCEITIVDDDPYIIQVDVASTPAQGDTYAPGETIELTAKFSIDVDVDGDPRLGMWVGDNWRQAKYLRGSGTRYLTFGYTVQTDDRDSDGIKMDGGYEDADGNWHNFINREDVTAAGTDFAAYPAYPGFDDQSGHKVDGSRYPKGVSMEVVSEPAADGVYRYGETIEVSLELSGAVDIDGDVLLNGRVGDESSWRGFKHKEGSGTDTLTFAYTVEARDLDTDGFVIESSYVQDGVRHGWGGSGKVTITSTDVAVPPNFTGIGNQEGHGVDGRPYPNEFRVTSRPKAEFDVYGRDETIEVTVGFDQDVTAGDEAAAALALDESSGSRNARYISGSGTNTLTFRYTVQEGDVDEDGIMVSFPVGQDVKATGTEVSYNPHPAGDGVVLQSEAFLYHKVDGSLLGADETPPTVSEVRFASEPGPGSDETYAGGDRVGVEVVLGEAVTVTGEPQIQILVGAKSRQAVYESGTSAPDAPATYDTVVSFWYTVQEEEQDEDGISISGNSITRTGGTIRDEAGNDANLNHEAVSDDSGHKVDAPDVTSPTIEKIEFSDSLDLQGGDDTYGAGDWLGVLVTFDEEVVVTGAPRMGIEIGDNVRQAEAWHLPDFLALSEEEKAIPVRVVFFGYTVQEGEGDDDGISVAEDSITLNRGTIQDEAGNNAELTHEALADDPGHKVDAPDVTGPTVSAVSITSDPGSDGTYGSGSEIEITVTFDEAVVVTGSPQLELDMYGSADPTARQTAYDSDESSGAAMVFTYTVVAGDKASDGLEIPANALTLNSGTIQDGAGNNADLTLAQHGPDADHLVDGAGGV